MEPKFAHLVPDEEGAWRRHELLEHLEAVARLAGEMASYFGSFDWAEVAGLWHDLGKYRPAFQQYIRRVTGYEAENAHIESRSRVDHSTAGAIHAVERFGVHGRILAYLIAGHHAGLPDWHCGESALSCRLSKTELLEDAKRGEIPAYLMDAAKPTGAFVGGKAGFALWVRMLFSCLVDADFLDTEAFMDPVKGRQREGYPAFTELLPIFERHISKKTAEAINTPVNRIRAEVLDRCIDGAALPPGIFSLTVPTGGGKTLSSLAFALHHAKCHGLRRVIYAIPYTSIIEQTAGIFRGIFGDAVLEHHSNLDPEKEDARSRLAAENWDAPIVVTTNVQFFESLFSARSSRCRKLHNIAGSVVVLDEAHLLPPEFLASILDVIRLLAAHYRVTFLLCSATQPALQSRQEFGWSFAGLDGVTELMPDPDTLYSVLDRVNYRFPINLHESITWDALAEQISQQDSALCIVNRRDDARDLWRAMPEGTLHLSALMCGEHRARVIAEIKARLNDGIPTRVVSTQLVEAGVDVDFPVVFRALAGMDSLAQAAGRCNREGNLDGKGQVAVFVPPKPAPMGLLRKGEQASKSLLHGQTDFSMDRQAFRRYFELFYRSVNSFDEDGILDLLKAGGGMEVQFRSAAERFQLIDDAGQQAVLVPYDEGAALIGKLGKDGPERWLLRRLQRYTVNIPRRLFQKIHAQGDVEEVWQGFFAALPALYDEQLGLLPAAHYEPEDLIG